MKYLIILIILFRFSTGFSQEKIFKDYDFQSGEYALIFVDVTEHEESYFANKKERRKAMKQTAFIDSKIHFIIDSISTLENIKETWTGEKANAMYFCWYDYFIYLTKNDSVISEMKVNFECNELIVDKQPFVFDSTNVTSFLNLADTVVKTDYRFRADKKKGKKNWRKVEADSSVVLKGLMKPFWVDFEGKFQIEYIDSTDVFGEPLKVLIEDKIKDAYPDENFKLKWASTSFGNKDEPNEFSYYVISNKTLYDKFKILQVDKEWEYYNNFGMTVFRRKPNR